MDPRELKARYQKLLKDYHSNVIDWKTFEMGLLAIKRERATIAVSDDDSSFPDTQGIERMRRNRFTEQETGTTDSDPDTTGSGSLSISTVPGSSLCVDSVMPMGEGSSTFRTDPKFRQTMSSRPRVGSVLSNQYTLQHILGTGTFGDTWRAKDATTENYVVVKLLPQSIRNNTKSAGRFFDVFRRVTTLKHRNICPIYFLDEDDLYGPFIVSACLDAVPLDNYYAQYIQTLQTFPLTAVVRVLWSVAVALDYARDRKIFHRGLKPNNVLIGKTCGVLVADFGLTETIRTSQRELGIVSNASDGGPWRAPEVWQDSRYSGQSDQFSLAVLAYQMIADTLPFIGCDEADLREKIINATAPPIDGESEFVNAALQRGLAKDPFDRFPSCLHFVKALIEPTESIRRRGLWALLFGVPRPTAPACVASETNQVLWPFVDDEATSNLPDIQIPQQSVYPYTEAPMSGTTVMASVFGSLTGMTVAIVGGLAVVSLGTGIALTTLLRGSTEDAPPSDPPKQETSIVTESAPAIPRSTPPDTKSTTAFPTEVVEEPLPVPADELVKLTELASKGDVVALRRLGTTYFHGKGVTINYEVAIRYFQQSARKDDAMSLYYLGHCNEVGLGVPKNIDLAKHFYTRAEKQGSREAQLALRRLNVLVDD